jgi:CYTH domain-containing protein
MAHNNFGVEIEKKFVINGVPDFLLFPYVRISQGYIPSGNNLLTLRIRQLDGKYFFALKVGGGISKYEVEPEIPPGMFVELKKLIKWSMVEKIRFLIPYGKYVIEFDVFGGNLAGLVFAEVEFESIDEAQAFSPPDWFGKEVTDNKQYTNIALSRDGIPSEAVLFDAFRQIKF